jgi:hypothetical protein
MTNEELIATLIETENFLERDGAVDWNPMRQAVRMAIRRLETPEPPPGSIEIRIAVAVADEKNWVCRGSKIDGVAQSDEDNLRLNNLRLTCQTIGGGPVGYLVVAHIPIREVPTIQGTVTPVEEPTNG